MFVICSCNNIESTPIINNSEITAQSHLDTYPSTTAITVNDSIPIDNIEYNSPKITDIDPSAQPMQFGREYGLWLSKNLSRFFGYSSSANWKIEIGKTLFDNTYQSREFHRCLGFYNNKGSDMYTPMTYDECKKFLITTLAITNNCFDALCHDMPSAYLGKNDELYISQHNGYHTGWDYSYIDSYKISDNSITYNCIQVGLKHWGYADNIFEPFTFTLVNDKESWKLDSCTNYKSLCFDFVGLENDIPLINSQDYVIDSPDSILNIDPIFADPLSCDNQTVYSNTDTYSYTLNNSDFLLDKDQQIYKAAFELAKDFLEDQFSYSEKRTFRITKYRNLKIYDIQSTKDISGNILGWITLSDRETISDNAWIVLFDAEYQWDGYISPLGYAHNVPVEERWVNIITSIPHKGFYMYRINDTFYIQSRNAI